MGIPQKGSRPICVQNGSYRWLIRRKATYRQVDYGNGYLHVAVALEENQGTTLVIFTDHPHPNHWATEAIKPITPDLVAAWILMALDLGWQPAANGPQFRVAIDENGQMIRL